MNKFIRFLRAALGLFALNFSATALMAQDTPKIEILHFWSADAEQRALGVFRDEAKSRGVDWHETIINGNRDSLQIEFSNLMTIGLPPSVVHWVTDGQLDDLIERGVFTDIPDPEGQFKDLYVPEVYELIKSKNGVSSAAVGIHSYNFLIYNRALMDKYNLKPAKDLDQLLEYGEMLAGEGVYLTSVSRQSWQLRYPMLSAMSNEMSADEVIALLTEGVDTSYLREPLIRSFEYFTQILAYNDPNTIDQEWTESVRKVEDGEALVAFLGDFAVPQFKAEADIICQATPNSKDMYLGIDSFAFVNVDDPALKAGQLEFINISTDPKLVAQYLNLKGGLPTIKGVNPDDLLPCHRENLERWESSEKIWVRSEATTRRYAALTQFLAVQLERPEMDAEIMADELINLLNSFY